MDTRRNTTHGNLSGTCLVVTIWSGSIKLRETFLKTMICWASVRAKLFGGQVRRSADLNDPRKWPMEVSVLELILHWLTFLTNDVNVTQVLAAARAGYSQRTLGNSPRTAHPGGGECYVVTPTLKWYRKYRSVTSHYWVFITVTGVKRASLILATSSP